MLLVCERRVAYNDKGFCTRDTDIQKEMRIGIGCSQRATNVTLEDNDTEDIVSVPM